jgi:hypothetical protein
MFEIRPPKKELDKRNKLSKDKRIFSYQVVFKHLDSTKKLIPYRNFIKIAGRRVNLKLFINNETGQKTKKNKKSSKAGIQSVQHGRSTYQNKAGFKHDLAPKKAKPENKYRIKQSRDRENLYSLEFNPSYPQTKPFND